MPKTRLLALSLSLLLAAISSSAAAGAEVSFRSEYLNLGQSFIYEGSPGGAAEALKHESSRSSAQVTANLSSMTDLLINPHTVRVIPRGVWRRDPQISNYGGPDDHGMFNGKRTACGQTFGPYLVGVAHRTLPCGTRVAFRNRGRIVVVRVVDRGPYVRGRQFDLTIAAARALRHVYTGPIDYMILGR